MIALRNACKLQAKLYDQQRTAEQLVSKQQQQLMSTVRRMHYTIEERRRAEEKAEAKKQYAAQVRGYIQHHTLCSI